MKQELEQMLDVSVDLVRLLVPLKPVLRQVIFLAGLSAWSWLIQENESISGIFTPSPHAPLQIPLEINQAAQTLSHVIP
jgi:hypothetical protein